MMGCCGVLSECKLFTAPYLKKKKNGTKAFYHNPKHQWVRDPVTTDYSRIKHSLEMQQTVTWL